mmetsp:Transcript_39960/g.58747  ORF Transcript_39960/g.58747 Transcript_39960/m.58747 type:complete len:215 (+) Transcript_39960:27-671(+)
MVASALKRMPNSVDLFQHRSRHRRACWTRCHIQRFQNLKEKLKKKKTQSCGPRHSVTRGTPRTARQNWRLISGSTRLLCLTTLVVVVPCPIVRSVTVVVVAPLHWSCVVVLLVWWIAVRIATGVRWPSVVVGYCSKSFAVESLFILATHTSLHWRGGSLGDSESCARTKVVEEVVGVVLWTFIYGIGLLQQFFLLPFQSCGCFGNVYLCVDGTN